MKHGFLVWRIGGQRDELGADTMGKLSDGVLDFVFGASRKHPIPTMDGALSPNDDLENLVSRQIRMPDDVALAASNNGLLVSAGANLVELYDGSSERNVKSFKSAISAFTRLNDGSLVSAVDEGGLVHLDSEYREVESVDRVEGTALRGVTAIVADRDGTGVYFTIGSTEYMAGEWVRDLMAGNRKGLMGHWSFGKGAEILRTNLAFPNGLLWEPEGKRLLYTESWSHSVSAVTVHGGEFGAVEMLIENLPGYPARLGAAREGGFWLALFALRTQLVELVLREKAFREDMIRSLEPGLWICPALASTGSHWEPLQMGGMKKLGIQKAWAPSRSYGLVVRADATGEIQESLHSRNNGSCHGITAVREVGDRLIIVSKGGNKLLIKSLLNTDVGAK